MALRKEKKKISQNDLRKLMKERKEISSEKNIESPLAKYDSTGRLSCIACNEIIKAGTLWRTHILSKTHKQNLYGKNKRKHDEPDNSQQNIKKGKLETATPSTKSNNINGENSLENSSSQEIATSSNTGVDLIQDYPSSSDEEENNSSSLQSSSTPPSTVPSDFFDNKVLKSEETVTENAPEVPNVLPEGFFDDPVLDAYARNTVYKDPLDEEMEKFQKEIAEATNISENMIDEEIELSSTEKTIEQIDEQMYYLSRVIEVQKKTEKIKETISEKLKSNDSEMMEVDSEGSNIEEDEKLLEELTDWRAKKMW